MIKTKYTPSTKFVYPQIVCKMPSEEMLQGHCVSFIVSSQINAKPEAKEKLGVVGCFSGRAGFVFQELLDLGWLCGAVGKSCKQG